MKNQSNSTYTDILKIRISKDLLAKAKKTAKDSELSLSAFVRMILKDYLVAKERELTNEIERIRRREKRTTISEREKEAFRYFVAKERKERENK